VANVPKSRLMSSPAARRLQPHAVSRGGSTRLAFAYAAKASVDDLISPELALVSPELADAARSRLPERPWEVALTRACPSAVDGAMPERSTRRPIVLTTPRDASNARDKAAVPVRPAPHAANGARHLRRQRLRPPARERRAPLRLLSWLILAGLVACVAAAGALFDSWTSGGESVLRTKPPVQGIAHEAHVERRLLARAGYVVSPAGSFMTGRSGATIAMFTLPFRCRASQQLVIRNVRISDGLLRFAGNAVGRRAFVRVSGRVLDRRRVRGTVFASGPRCTPRHVGFSARVS
jgi:hypothetical protein